MTDEPAPERRQTIRDAIYFALREQTLTLRELSAAVGVRERDLPDHLQHLERSLGADGASLRIEPARCVACDFVFETRTRLAKPGRCPRCRATRIAPPRFAVVAGG